MDCKILIADDELHIRLLLEQTFEDLEDEGATLFIAADGAEALDMVEAHKPDLILLDIMMPKIDGFNVCDTVKNKWRMRDVFIILLTAQGQEKDRDTGQLVGADLYITKPFDPDELFEKAAEVLRSKGCNR